MDLIDALAQTKSAIVRAEAEGFENTAQALREFAAELEVRRSKELVSARHLAETSQMLRTSSTKLMKR